MSQLDDELQERLRAHQDACAAGMAIERQIESAVALVALAEDERYRECRVRICLYDKLIEAYRAYDDVGYADEVAAVSAKLERETTPGHSCYYCLRIARVESARLLGRIDEAEALWRAATLVTPNHEFFDLYYVPMLDCQRMWLALETGDIDASRTCMVRTAERLRVLDGCRDHTERYRLAHENTREMLHEMAVIHALVAGDVEEAVLEYDRGAALDEPSTGRAEVQLVLAEALVAAESLRAESLLRDVLVFMEPLGRPRDLCRIYLAQAKGARARGDADALNAALAAATEQLGRLKSRDLHVVFAELQNPPRKP